MFDNHPICNTGLGAQGPSLHLQLQQTERAVSKDRTFFLAGLTGKVIMKSLKYEVKYLIMRSKISHLIFQDHEQCKAIVRELGGVVSDLQKGATHVILGTL